MTKYKLCTLDVWGNENDGYDINDYFTAGYITLSENCTDDLLLDAIDGLIGIKNRHLAEIRDDYNGFIEVSNKKNGMPVFHLYLENLEGDL